MTIPEIQRQIAELAEQYFKLVNPTIEELTTAREMLTDDSLNDIHGIVDVDSAVGQILIADEVVVMREIEEEEQK